VVSNRHGRAFLQHPNTDAAEGSQRGFRKNLNISPLRRGSRINPVRAESVFRFHHQVREFIFGNRSKWLAKLASRFLLRS
jgi:hypothetical protein